jgi:DNA mismatch endonuclease (patch repair protein)
MPKRSKRLPLTRSEIMKRVRQSSTHPEMVLRKKLHARGLRFRVNYRAEGIRVDIAFVRARVAIFVDGCFWHSCPIHGSRPSTNKHYWLPKLRENRSRDRRQTRILIAKGWNVTRVWEHDCKANSEILIASIQDLICQAGSDIKGREKRKTHNT